uniref:J domain-containing protein n=1 Tax=Pseudo-nitzschia australis TaxID=44445 RepID=A0A6U9XRK7_9STRA|mmetsp:Transcript_17151/g.35459  ORF Transcript_17151/g.35459 Transcript_17151/m.35459 type:complete len:257 (-) Transcript_17151:1144-1914(-)
MLITLLSYFGQNNRDFGSGETYDDYSDTSPTESIVRDTMSPVDTFYDGDEEEEWEKVLVPIPLSVEEGYEIVLPTSNFPATNNNNDNDKDAALSAARSSSTDAAPSTARSSSNTGSSILQRIKDWHHQLSLQRNQLGLSITKTFAELSNEDPSQMEKDFIQRAMELSMLDVALVHYHHGHRHSSNHIQQEQKLLPHNILGVAENANPAEIKSAYRKLARLHVSEGIRYYIVLEVIRILRVRSGIFFDICLVCTFFY